MRAFWHAVLAFCLVIVVIQIPAMAYPAATPTKWTMTAETKVGWGAPELVQITGPPGGQYVLNITGQPYSTSYPLISFEGAIRNLTGLPTVSVVNLSIPTDNLSLGPYRATLHAFPGYANLTSPVYFRVVDPLNDTIIANQIAFLQYNVTIDEQRLFGLQAQQVAFQGQLTGIYLTILAIGILFTFALFITRTNVGEREWALRIKRFLSDLVYGSVFREMATWAMETIRPTPPTPGKFYRSWYCRKCKIIDRTKEEMIRHLLTAHRIRNAQMNVNYRIYAPTVRAIARYYSEPAVVRDPARDAAVRSLTVDLTHLGGKK